MERLGIHADARGFVFEPLTGGELGAQRNCHVVINLPGAVRGNHQHALRTEILAVVGPALVRYREHGELKDVTVGENEAVRFVFPPGVPHAIRNTGEQPQVILSFNDQLHDPGRPDVTPVALL